MTTKQQTDAVTPKWHAEPGDVLVERAGSVVAWTYSIEDAAAIARRCDAHEALVSALRALEDRCDLCDANGKRKSVDYHDDAREQARAALALAEGK